MKYAEKNIFHIKVVDIVLTVRIMRSNEIERSGYENNMNEKLNILIDLVQTMRNRSEKLSKSERATREIQCDALQWAIEFIQDELYKE